MKFVWLIGLVGSVACSSSTTTEAPKTDAAACEDLTGTWKIDGCLVKQCVIAQSACDVTFNCTSIVNTQFATTGTASGKDVSFASSELTCQLAVAGSSMAGDCTSEAGTCKLNGTLQ